MSRTQVKTLHAGPGHTNASSLVTAKQPEDSSVGVLFCSCE